MKPLNDYLTENATFTMYYVEKFIEDKIGRDVMIKYNFDMHIPMTFVDWVSIYIPMYMDDHKLDKISFEHWSWLTKHYRIRTHMIEKDYWGRGYNVVFEPEEPERIKGDYINMLLIPPEKKPRRTLWDNSGGASQLRYGPQAELKVFRWDASEIQKCARGLFDEMIEWIAKNGK